MWELGRRSETKVEAGCVEARRSCGQQRLLRISLTVVLLGIDTRPIGEGRDVADADVQAAARGAHVPAHERLAEVVRRRHFANADEVVLLDVAVRRLYRREPVCDRTRLPPERNLEARDVLAGHRLLAEELLLGVEDAEAALVIDERR